MKRLSFDASVAAVKRKPGETAEHLASRIAADNHSETEQEFSILRAIEEVELDLAEAVRLLRAMQWAPGPVRGDVCPRCRCDEPRVGVPPDGPSGGHAGDCELSGFLARVDAR